MPTTWAVTRQIVRDNGMGSKGLFKGLTATFGRNGVFNMVYFGFYHSVKNIVPESKVGSVIVLSLAIVMYTILMHFNINIYYNI